MNLFIFVFLDTLIVIFLHIYVDRVFPYRHIGCLNATLDLWSQLHIDSSMQRCDTSLITRLVNSWFCKEIREDNSRFWWRRVHEDASQGMYMSKIEIFFFTARILQNQRMLCCGECFHD